MKCAPNCTCCCDGVKVSTPRTICNRPGLNSLAYRVGTHGSFLESMKARLASDEFPALQKLGVRTGDDPSIAMLDAWATVADVLTFYQERLANEGYLRTALERRSVAELARLIGYEPRPGVASTVYLAYEVDKNAQAPVEISAGSKTQSLPDPGELPQTFETSEAFIARKEWNAIEPRMDRPQAIDRIVFGTDDDPLPRLYLEGISTDLKVNDALLIQFGEARPWMIRVTAVKPDADAGRTLIRFKRWNGQDIPVPADILVGRALKSFANTSAAEYPEQSMAAQALVETSAFLNWLWDETEATPLLAEVASFAAQTNLVTAMLADFEEFRRQMERAPDDRSVAGPLTKFALQLAAMSDEIEEFTGMDGGGRVGEATDQLAERLNAIDLDNPAPESFADFRTSALMGKILGDLAEPRSVPPRNSQTLDRVPSKLFDRNSDVATQAVAAMEPRAARELATAFRNAELAPAVSIRVFALRKKALLFASSAPRKVTGVSPDTGVVSTEEWTDIDIKNAEQSDAVYLDSPQDKIQQGSWVVLDYSSVSDFALGGISLPSLSADRVLIARAGLVASKVSRVDYGFAAQTTRIPLIDPADNQSLSWFRYTPPGDTASNPTAAFQFIRNLAVYGESEELPLALEPIKDEICGGEQWIETDNLYSGLETGRWLVVSGERTDVEGTEGVHGSELVMLDAVKNYVERADRQGSSGGGDLNPLAVSATDLGPAKKTAGFAPGEKLHTYLKLARPLSYCYKRSTFAINANVAKASHGETRAETLGGGDARASLQSFALRQPPLTFVSANEPDGISSTLRIYVNDLEWHESESLASLGPNSRGFLARTNDDGVTSVTFGNGVRGARLPSGTENVMAIYRNGIGKAGNVKAGQISQLLSRPLGVKGVNNPLEASGGADRETRDQARKNAPLAVMALDRLVGIRDYADFSRTFAGIGKAVSTRITAGDSAGVHVTVAGVDDIPIEKSSDLYANLTAALRTYGDPDLAVHVEARELLLLVLTARISPSSDYRWEDVVDRVREALLDRYSFERQELGRSVVLSEVIALIQAQRGVRYVDVDAMGGVAQRATDGALRSPQKVAEAMQSVVDQAAQKGRPDSYVPVNGIRVREGVVRAAQIAFFAPSLPETLILNRIEEDR